MTSNNKFNLKLYIPPADDSGFSGFDSENPESNVDDSLVTSSAPLIDLATPKIEVFKTPEEDSGLESELINLRLEDTVSDISPVAETQEELLSDKEVEEWELKYAQNEEGDTQLHLAIIQGFLEVAINLIELAPHPCVLNVTNNDEVTALHLAVMAKQPIIVRRLVLAGADLNVKTPSGNTALHVACIAGDVVSARALTNPVSQLEWKLYLANSHRLPAIPQNLEEKNYTGSTCLHLATMSNSPEIARLLLNLGADLEARESLRGMTSLMLAIRNRSRRMIDFYFQCRPNYQTKNYAGYTAYQEALLIHNYDLAREMILRGATPQPLPESDSDSESDESEIKIRNEFMGHEMPIRC